MARPLHAGDASRDHAFVATDPRPDSNAPSDGRLQMTRAHSSLVGLAPLLALAACTPRGAGFGGEAEGAEPPLEGALARQEAAEVLVVPLERREMVRELTTTTNVESEQQVELFPRAAGVVEEVRVEEGDRVAEGDVLLVLDQRAARAAVDEADIAVREALDTKEQLELALAEAEEALRKAELTAQQSERELERKRDVGQGLLSKNELEQLELTHATNLSDRSTAEHARDRAQADLAAQDTAIERARLQLRQAELELSYTELDAPFDGVVAERRVHEGDAATTSTAAFVLTDLVRVRAVVFRPQRELAFFRAAQTGDAESLTIRVEPEAAPGVHYDGGVRFISPTIDPTSGQFRVTLGLEQPGEGDERPPLLPGMLLRVSIVTDRHPNALVAPKRALLREGEAYFVFVVEDGHARRVRVTEGYTDDELVELVPADEATLAPGDSIVVVGNRDLEDGAPVRAEPWRPPGAAAPEAAHAGAEADDVAEADGE